MIYLIDFIFGILYELFPEFIDRWRAKRQEKSDQKKKADV